MYKTVEKFIHASVKQKGAQFEKCFRNEKRRAIASRNPFTDPLLRSEKEMGL